MFDELEMHKTAAQNAVLIYVGYKNHLCAIVGDKGIHQFVDVAYWQLQCDLMIEQFKQKAYTQRHCGCDRSYSVIFYLAISLFSLMM